MIGNYQACAPSLAEMVQSGQMQTPAARPDRHASEPLIKRGLFLVTARALRSAGLFGARRDTTQR